jgi:hypothetical protein
MDRVHFVVPECRVEGFAFDQLAPVKVKEIRAAEQESETLVPV